MLLVLAAVLSLSDPTRGAIIDVRIADVIAEPERYGGQTLRIRGQIDACYGYVCSICPEDMTLETLADEQCLRMSFDGFADEESWSAEDTRYAPSVRGAMEEAFRYSVLTGEGTFDPSCLTHRPWPPEPDAAFVDEVLCMDRATTWRGVQVKAVHRRIMSNDGLIFGSHKGRLTEAPEEVSGQVKMAYQTYLPFSDAGHGGALKVFLPEFPVLGSEGGVEDEEARLCVCLKDDCEGDWPRHDISVWAHTVNDPYVCHAALKVDGVWGIYP